MLLDSYRLEIFNSKCQPGAMGVHCFAHLDQDVSCAMPYLNASLGGFEYIKDPPSVTFKAQGKLITVHGNKIAVNALRDEAEAQKIIEWLKREINDAWENRNEITPSYEGAPRPKVIEILKLLPNKMGCRECGEPTCMVFATKVAEGGKGADNCTQLNDVQKDKLNTYMEMFKFEKSINPKTSNESGKREPFTRKIERILSPYFVNMRFKSGRILWNEGEAAGRMISIISGKVKIFRPLADGKQAAIYIFGPGDTFGFMPLLNGTSYPASAEVVDDIEALVMTREKLHAVMKQYPEIAIVLLGHLGKRLREAFDQIERLSTRGVIPRTAAALISLSVQSGGVEDLEIISLPVSSREYASLAGLTPESFSRGITKLADMGIIHRLKANSFQILDHERLLSEAKNIT